MVRSQMRHTTLQILSNHLSGDLSGSKDHNDQRMNKKSKRADRRSWSLPQFQSQPTFNLSESIFYYTSRRQTNHFIIRKADIMIEPQD
jgi:hypothetical protein